MGLTFFAAHATRRTVSYPPQPELEQVTEHAEELKEKVDLAYECPAAEWHPLTPQVPAGFRPIEWAARPRRFVDGRDVGEIIATLRSPEGYPIPVRLAQIGAAVMAEEKGCLRRTAEVVQRTVTMVGDPFAWNELEGLAAELQVHGFRLLLARTPKFDDPRPLYDFEVMRKATEARTNHEMAALEDSVTHSADAACTLVDGGLEKRFGVDQSAALIGVIKSHWRNYLSAQTMQTLYELQPGQRTPPFLCQHPTCPTVSFYVRLAGGMPNWGLIRVELPQLYYEQARSRDPLYLNKLACTLFAYRCRQPSYGRQPVSLHPIMRVEQSLGALLSPTSRLVSNFYRIANL